MSDEDEPLGDIATEVRERTGDGTPTERTDSSEREGPLSDVASEVDNRRRKRSEGSDAFESVDVGELDGEKLWEQLAEGDDDTGDDAVASVPLEDASKTEWEDVPEAEWEDGRDVRTIPKETCHGCPHFGTPPDLACTHEGTAILAMPDSEHFRVADCPIVGQEDDINTFTDESDDSDGVQSEAEY